MKTCNVCHIPKELKEFTKDSSTKDKLDGRCRTCKAEIYESIDKTERAEWRREYYLNHLEHELTLCELYRNANKTARNAYIAEYQRLNPGKGAAKTAKYRASKLRLTPKWLTIEQLKEMELVYINRPEGYEVDHIIPLQGKQVNGLHVPWNLQYLVSVVNKRKSNRLNYQE